MGLYNAFKTRQLTGERIDLIADQIKVALVTADYVPDLKGHKTFADVGRAEVRGKGYNTGGLALNGKKVEQDDDGDESVFRAADLAWPDSEITARGAVIYKQGAAANTSPLIGFIPFGKDKTSSADAFRIKWHKDGILNLG